MNWYFAVAIGLFAFTVAAGFIQTTDAAWCAGQRIYIPVVLGLGIGCSIGLVIVGAAVRS